MHSLPVPVADRERLASLDVLRGVAVLGILTMNIWSYALPVTAYGVPTAYGDLTGANLWAYRLTHVLAELKFMAIFSMLFGAGIVLMSERREARGEPTRGLHYRRVGWLIVFGLLHAHLLWFGDILFTYGVCGLWLFLVRKARPSRLIAGGVGVLILGSSILIGSGVAMSRLPPDELAAIASEQRPSPEDLAEEIAAYRGSWLDQMRERVPTALAFETQALPFFLFWRASGLMLIGMGLFKLGFLTARRSASSYWAWIALAALVGVPVIVFGMQRNFAAGFPAPFWFLFGSQFNYWMSVVVGLGWTSVVMLIEKGGHLPRVRQRLAKVGQMAFTNYVLQSVICTTIFYGHGFGLFGRVDRAGLVLVVAAVWAFELLLSPVWLRHFRFGPLEWLWRTLAYQRVQPMRQRTA